VSTTAAAPNTDRPAFEGALTCRTISAHPK
jgi:hypothetical protein